MDVQIVSGSFHLQKSTEWPFKGNLLFHFYSIGVINMTEAQSSSASNSYWGKCCCVRRCWSCPRAEWRLRCVLDCHPEHVTWFFLLNSWLKLFFYLKVWWVCQKFCSLPAQNGLESLFKSSVLWFKNTRAVQSSRSTQCPRCKFPSSPGFCGGIWPARESRCLTCWLNVHW